MCSKAEEGSGDREPQEDDTVTNCSAVTFFP